MNNNSEPHAVRKYTKCLVMGLAFCLILMNHITSPAQCTDSDTILCLQEGRFKVEVTFQNFVGNEYSLDGTGLGGNATAVTHSQDTGFFWFYTEDNIEIMVKVLDATVVNGYFWVFASATTNAEYAITVTDTTNDTTRVYTNPSGNFASPITDTQAFGSSSKHSPKKTFDISQWHGTADYSDITAMLPVSEKKTSGISESSSESQALYLMDGRFRVDTTWRTYEGHNGRGNGEQLNGDISGYFWFFSDNNIEMIVKVLDGSSVNGNYWFFFAAVTNIEYEITLTDTTTGKSITYFNPFGVSSPGTGDNDPALMKQYYGVHVTSAEQWRQRVIVFNNSAEENSFTFESHNTSGEQASEETFSVPPNSYRTLIMTGDTEYSPTLSETPLSPVEGTFTIHTDSLDIRPLLSYQYEDSLSMSDFFLQSSTQTEYLLPNRVLPHFDWTGIAVMNPSSHTIDLTLTAYKDGAVAGEIEVQVPSHSKYVDITQNIWSGLDYTSIDQIKIESSTVPFPPPIMITGNDKQDRHIFFNGAVTGTENR